MSSMADERPVVWWKLFSIGMKDEPTNRRRGRFIIDGLRGHGWTVVEKEDERAKIVVLQRSATPDEVQKHQQAGRTVCYETNDIYLFKDTRFYNPKEAETVRLADFVIVTCRWMQRRYGRLNPNTLIAPEALEDEFWTTKQATLPKRPLILSWHGMPDNLQYVEPLVEELAGTRHLCLRIVMPEKDSRGQSNRERVKAWPVPTQFAVWQRDRFVQDIAAAHAGMAVLPDTEFCRCKAHHKVVGYQALGMPCIASNLPGYREVIKDGETGFLAETTQEWLEAIKSLRNPRTRRRVGRAGRRMSRHFTREAVVALWDKLLREIWGHASS